MKELFNTPQLITGIFFQDNARLGIAHDSAIGARAVVQKELRSYMFHGVIGRTPDNPDTLSGFIIDKFGTAMIENVNIVNKNSFIFEKCYETKPGHAARHPITYQFRKIGESPIWSGVWSGADAGSGQATCQLSDCHMHELADYNKLVENLKKWHQ